MGKEYYPKLKCLIIFSVIGNILFLKIPLGSKGKI